MASSLAQIVTLAESQPLQTWHIVLREKAESLASRKPEQAQWLDILAKVWNNIDNFVTRGKNPLNLEVESDPETTKRNKQKIDKLFDSMIKKLLAQKEEVKAEMDNMNPEQQEDILSFWGEVNMFMMDVFDWMKESFLYILDKIRTGFRLIKETVRDVFKTISDLLKMIF